MTKWSNVFTKADFWFQKSHEELDQLQATRRPKS